MIELFGAETSRELAKIFLSAGYLLALGEIISILVINLFLGCKCFVTDETYDISGGVIWRTFFKGLSDNEVTETESKEGVDDECDEEYEGGEWAILYVILMLCAGLLTSFFSFFIWYWEFTSIVALFVGMLYLARGGVRFNKKLNKHMEDKEAHKGEE